jgi:hypothetical protein
VVSASHYPGNFSTIYLKQNEKKITEIKLCKDKVPVYDHRKNTKIAITVEAQTF